jgi:hypothetical protein
MAPEHIIQAADVLTLLHLCAKLNHEVKSLRKNAIEFCNFFSWHSLDQRETKC